MSTQLCTRQTDRCGSPPAGGRSRTPPAAESVCDDRQERLRGREPVSALRTTETPSPSRGVRHVRPPTRRQPRGGGAGDWIPSFAAEKPQPLGARPSSRPRRREAPGSHVLAVHSQKWAARPGARRGRGQLARGLAVRGSRGGPQQRPPECSPWTKPLSARKAPGAGGDAHAAAVLLASVGGRRALCGPVRQPERPVPCPGGRAGGAPDAIAEGRVALARVQAAPSAHPPPACRAAPQGTRRADCRARRGGPRGALTSPSTAAVSQRGPARRSMAASGRWLVLQIPFPFLGGT